MIRQRLAGMLRFCDRQMLLAALSGLLLAGAFPPVGQGWLAFVALIPLLLVSEHRPFASGFVCGVFFFAPLLYWLNIVMTTYGGLAPFFSAAAWLMLCVYLALFFGLAIWIMERLRSRLQLPLTLSLPLIWVAAEYLRGTLFTGFPWGLVGYAAIDMPTLSQAAALFGVYGLSFLFVLVNCVLCQLFRWKGISLHVPGLLICALLLSGAMIYGQNIPVLDPSTHQTLTVGVAQGNIAQEHKWDRRYRQQTLDRYRALSSEAADKGAQLLVWPEAAAPFYLQDDSVDSRQVRELSRQTGRSLLLGGPSYEAAEEGSYRYHNSAFLLDAEGRTTGRSDKIHLVPFGEYVPLGRLLFFIKRLVVGVGDFTPGKVNPLSLNGHDLGVLICYEAIFPNLARDYVRHGSDLLVNLTNDAWFGRSSAPRQLLDMTRMRAIENRTWVVRAANTGISALIDPLGRTHKQTELFEMRYFTGKVSLGSRGSLYLALGDLLPYASLGFVVLFLLLAWRKGKVPDDANAVVE